MNIHYQLAANVHHREQRGRGVALFPSAVKLEPYAPFRGHRVRLANEGRDTGAKTTFLSRLADKAFRALQSPKARALAARQPVGEVAAGPSRDWFEKKEPGFDFCVTLDAHQHRLIPGRGGLRKVVANSDATMAHLLTTLRFHRELSGWS